MKINLKIFIGPIIIIIIWFLIGELKLISPLFIPPIENVFAKLISLFISGDIIKDLLKTLLRMFGGYFIAAIIGIPIGIIIGYSKKLYESVEVIIEFLRSIPSPVLVPLSMLFFGLGDMSKIIIVAFTSSLVNIINTMYGVYHGSQTRKKVAIIFKASKINIIKYITVWDALPNIFIGLRLTINLSLIVTVVTEMFTGTIYGLGLRIYEAHDTGRIPEMYAVILLIGFIGYLFNKGFIYIEKKIVHWK